MGPQDPGQSPVTRGWSRASPQGGPWRSGNGPRDLGNCGQSCRPPRSYQRSCPNTGPATGLFQGDRDPQGPCPITLPDRQGSAQVAPTMFFSRRLTVRVRVLRGTCPRPFPGDRDLPWTAGALPGPARHAGNGGPWEWRPNNLRRHKSKNVGNGDVVVSMLGSELCSHGSVLARGNCTS